MRRALHVVLARAHRCLGRTVWMTPFVCPDIDYGIKVVTSDVLARCIQLLEASMKGASIPASTFCA